MLFENKRIALGLTSSFYAVERIIPQIKSLVDEGAEVIPVVSYNFYNVQTLSENFIKQIEDITKKKVIYNIQEAEPIGHKVKTDIMAIIPCTGNTIGKLANGIIDTPVLVAAKTNLKRRKQSCDRCSYK